MSSGAILDPFSLCSGVKMIATFLPSVSGLFGASPSLLRPLSDLSPTFGRSNNYAYLCPQLPGPGPHVAVADIPGSTTSMAFFSEKQAWPWWLMLILQLVQAAVDYFTKAV